MQLFALSTCTHNYCTLTFACVTIFFCLLAADGNKTAIVMLPNNNNNNNQTQLRNVGRQINARSNVNVNRTDLSIL